MLTGGDPETVRRALETGEALAGVGGFAGSVDGRLVRDVLGRYPLFSAADDPATWSFDPTDLADPDPVPAGHARDASGDAELWTLPDPEPYGDGECAVAAVRVAGAPDKRTGVQSIYIRSRQII